MSALKWPWNKQNPVGLIEHLRNLIWCLYKGKTCRKQTSCKQDMKQAITLISSLITAQHLIYTVFLFNQVFIFFCQVLCQNSKRWIKATITWFSSRSVIIRPLKQCQIEAVRYAWSDAPCVMQQCAIYSGNLPSPPFIKYGPFIKH